MAWIEYTAMTAERLKEKGYKYLAQGQKLTPQQVGYPQGSGFSHFEIIPHMEEPKDVNVYDAIDSPEGAAMAGGIDLVFFWLKDGY